MSLWQNLDMSERIAAGNNTQLKNLRKASRKYIHGTLSKELGERLSAMGIVGFTIENQTTAAKVPGPKCRRGCCCFCENAYLRGFVNETTHCNTT